MGAKLPSRRGQGQEHLFVICRVAANVQSWANSEGRGVKLPSGKHQVSTTS